MSCYFIVDTYIDEQQGRGEYDDYIQLVKPVVERYGGEYLVRTEKISSLSGKRNPQRVIVIRFDNREQLDACFSSPEYQVIMSKRTGSVDSRAVIAEGLD
ncbi:DUF1330 domain-containing protein [Anaerolentibacter hominis]|uniref:DUF1330 domain-containing protein n=1 Tax=Anaerolentibacter hominis TaxID=3079009 RepID=UPI0031B86A42